MNRQDLPDASFFCLPGGKPENLPGLGGEALGQGQVRRARPIEQLGHGLHRHGLHAQQPEQGSNLPRLVQQGQQNMDAAHIAVAQGAGFLSGGQNQLVCLHMITHRCAPFSKKFLPWDF